MDKKKQVTEHKQQSEKKLRSVDTCMRKITSQNINGDFNLEFWNNNIPSSTECFSAN